MKTKFYCLDLDMHSAEDFADAAQELDARDERDAALTMAIFEDLQDGIKARIMVADNVAGEDAVVFIITQRITVSYDIDEES